MRSLSTESTIENPRADEIFRQHQLSIYRQTDHLFAYLFPLQWLGSIIVSYLAFSLNWAGGASRGYTPIWKAIFLGGLIAIIPLTLILIKPGTALTRYTVAISQLVMSGLFIHLSGGRIETHFHIFGSLAILTFYRDWRVLVPATFVSLLDHFPSEWEGSLAYYSTEWRWAEHFAWALFIDIFLVIACCRSRQEMWDIAIRTANLDASEERYRAVVEQTQEGIFLLDEENLSVIESNEAFRRLVGCETPEEAKNLTLFDFTSATSAEFERLLHPQYSSAKTIHGETVFCRQNGTMLFVEVHVSPITYGGKRVFCANAKDVTERKLAEDELKKAHNELEERVAARTAELVQANEAMLAEVNERKRAERELNEAQDFLHKVINNLPNPLFVKDEEGKFSMVNEAFARLYGQSADGLIGKKDSDFHPPDEAQKFTADDQQVIANQEEKIIPEEKHTDYAGNIRFLQTIKRPLCLGENRPRLLLGISTDLTERRELESQLRQAQKLESIGQLAAGIAHEINTPTQYVGDNTRFVQESFSDLEAVLEKFNELLAAVRAGSTSPTLVQEVEQELKLADVEYLKEEIPNALQQSLEGVNRIAKIVQSMKDFAHPGSNEKKAADLNKAIESTITVARNEWKYVAEMETNFDDTLPLVPCLLGEFNQVILNITVNAAHAIAEANEKGTRNGKGKITITTQNVANQWAEIRISDTGAGILPEVRNRIFDPFFTTKEIGKGTGQGLAISHNVIVEKHQGKLSFETEVGHGTTFIIRLPFDQTQN